MANGTEGLSAEQKEWAEAFKREHGFYPWEDSALLGKGYSAAAALAEHLHAKDWSQQLGRPPTQDEWESHWWERADKDSGAAYIPDAQKYYEQAYQWMYQMGIPPGLSNEQVTAVTFGLTGTKGVTPGEGMTSPYQYEIGMTQNIVPEQPVVPAPPEEEPIVPPVPPAPTGRVPIGLQMAGLTAEQRDRMYKGLEEMIGMPLTFKQRMKVMGLMQGAYQTGPTAYQGRLGQGAPNIFLRDMIWQYATQQPGRTRATAEQRQRVLDWLLTDETLPRSTGITATRPTAAAPQQPAQPWQNLIPPWRRRWQR